MEKDVAINILEDIENALYTKNPKENTIKTLEIYRKNLEISTNKKIQKLVDKRKNYIQEYGKNGRKTLKLDKKIDKEIKKILKSWYYSLSTHHQQILKVHQFYSLTLYKNPRDIYMI